ncbi:MAG: hypothetical protein HQL56_09830 [Magnetococcales bacterium]|nr:hypothetical protein [Magnetococcales bacterium]
MASNPSISSFFRGDTKVVFFAFEENDGTPIDINGHELWFTLKTNLADPDQEAVFQKRVIFPPGPDAILGIGTLTLESTETETIEPGTFFYDLQRVIPGTPPKVTTLVSGRLSVFPDVTRRNG